MGDAGLQQEEGGPLEALILDVMKVQRRYAHEMRNVKSERQEKVREAVEAAAVRSGLPAEVTHGRLHFMPNDEAPLA